MIKINRPRNLGELAMPIARGDTWYKNYWVRGCDLRRDWSGDDVASRCGNEVARGKKQHTSVSIHGTNTALNQQS